MRCPVISWLDELLTLLLSVIFHVHTPTQLEYATMFQQFHDDSEYD